MHRRTLRAALDVLALVAREVSVGRDVDGDLLQRVVPVRGLFRSRDRTRVDVRVGLHLELVELDASPGTVEDDRLRDARGQPEERGLDRLDAVVGPLHTDGVSDFLPGAHLNREVSGGLLDVILAISFGIARSPSCPSALRGRRDRSQGACGAPRRHWGADSAAGPEQRPRSTPDSREHKRSFRNAPRRPSTKTQLALRGDGLLRWLGHDAELAQDSRNVVVAALLDDLTTFVEPGERPTLQINAPVRRRQLLARGRLERPGVRSGHSNLVRAVLIILLDGADDFVVDVGEPFKERRGVLPDGSATAQRLR